MLTENEKSLVSQHSFLLFLRSLLKKWWLFCIFGLVGGIAGFFYAMLQKPKYESNLTFVLDQGNNSRLSGALNFAAQFGLNLGSGDNDLFSGDNIIEIVKSRHIIENVFLAVDTFNSKPYTLIEFYRQNMLNLASKKTPPKPVHFPVGVRRPSLHYAQDSVLYATFTDFVKYSLEVDRPDKELNIFSIRVKTSNEKFTKVFTDKLIQATDSFYTDISSKKEKNSLEILERRVAFMKEGLSSSLSGKAASKDANINPAFAESQVPLEKQQMNIQVYGGAYSELFKNLEIARFQYLNKIPLIQIIDHANYPMKKIKISKLKTFVIFAFAASFFLFLYFWLVRLYKDIR